MALAFQVFYPEIIVLRNPEHAAYNETNNHRNAVMKPLAPKLSGFMRKSVKCKVPIGENRTALPTCSTDLFREYFSKIGSFPDCGTWLDSVGYGFSQRYGLDFCEFKPYSLPECSRRKGLHHILMMGDSTGWRNFMGLLNTTIYAGSTCHIVKDEGPLSQTPSSEYFSLGHRSLNNSFSVKLRGCHRCRASVFDCNMKTESGFHSLRLQFAAAYKFKDKSLTIPPGNPKWHSANTFQEFLFTTYLPLTGMPDTIVVSFPLNHEKFNDWIVQDFKYFIGVMLKHIPRTTQVHWIPTASEFETKRDPVRAAWCLNHTFSDEKLLATEYIYKLNNMLFKELKPYLLNSSYNMHGHLNLVNMSSTKEEWNEDGGYQALFLL
ncbi:hypothetical protein CAPTEDRAFT_213506 [Capitella teleta]|uniref:Uncharacterized protein n=1 Tax=Capitella teleta TaxID=283909 RepID=R7T7X4_CAPTE|nr:hypothetical protein CAPTEDRAFT_213506 [Capitella teleta]|eukprot:ELT87094.1 hypothetical protein CAPTEDRAFT_213506 [Capitella teleta]